MQWETQEPERTSWETPLTLHMEVHMEEHSDYFTTLQSADNVLIVTFPFLLSFLSERVMYLFDYTIKITGQGKKNCFSHSIVFFYLYF